MSGTPKTSRAQTRKLFLWLDQVRADHELPPVAFKVAYEIGQHFNSRYGGAAWPSSLTIAEKIGVAKPTVIRVVRQLREHGHLTVKPGRPGGRPGRNHPNRYFMVTQKGAAAHPRPAEKTAQDGKKGSTDGPFRGPRKGPFSTRKGPPVDPNYLEPSTGAEEAPRRGGGIGSLALASTPGAGAPDGAAPEEGKIREPVGEAGRKKKREVDSWWDSNTDEELLRTLRGLAHSFRLVQTLGNVRIDSGPDPEPLRSIPEARKARIRKLTAQLSPEDQQTLREQDQRDGTGIYQAGEGELLAPVADRFADLLAIWDRPHGEDEAAARRAYAAVLREGADPDEILDSAYRWLAAYADEPDKLKALDRWLAFGAWKKMPPRPSPRRNGGKVSLAAIMLRQGGVS